MSKEHLQKVQGVTGKNREKIVTLRKPVWAITLHFKNFT